MLYENLYWCNVDVELMWGGEDNDIDEAQKQQLGICQGLREAHGQETCVHMRELLRFNNINQSKYKCFVRLTSRYWVYHSFKL